MKKFAIAFLLLISFGLGWAGSGENMPDVGFSADSLILAGSGENMPDVG